MPIDITYYTTPLLEIVLIWVMLNYLLKFFWGTRAMDVVFGLLAFLFLFVLADKLHFPIIRRLMLHVVNVAAIVVFIIFQPETDWLYLVYAFMDESLLLIYRINLLSI